MAEVVEQRKVIKGITSTPESNPLQWFSIFTAQNTDFEIDAAPHDLAFQYVLKGITTNGSTGSWATFKCGTLYYIRGTNTWRHQDEARVTPTPGGPLSGELRIFPLTGATQAGNFDIQVYSALLGANARTFYRLEAIGLQSVSP